MAELVHWPCVLVVRFCHIPVCIGQSYRRHGNAAIANALKA